MTGRRGYLIEATAHNKDKFQIRTDDRVRALHFAALFRASDGYSAVSVETGGKIWIGEMIGRIP